MADYYDGTKLLSLKDQDGEKPEIYLCTTNRTAGKTTYFSRLLIKRFIQNHERFGLLYRFNYEVSSVEEKFFGDIKSLFFNAYSMHSAPCCDGHVRKLYLTVDDESEKPDLCDSNCCGYAIPLNSAEHVKKASHMLSSVTSLFMDEFQSEYNNYAAGEIDKFQSIHTSLARGHGKQSKYLPVYMCANNITILNPYYTALGIAERLTPETNYMRGHGWVLEQGYNESAAQAQETSTFNKAFRGSLYNTINTSKCYLYDNSAFVEKISAKNRYVCTIRCDGVDYGVREMVDTGWMYCDDKPDNNHPLKLSATTEDHKPNYTMQLKYGMFIAQLREYFEVGAFRFKNLRCKSAIIKALSF